MLRSPCRRPQLTLNRRRGAQPIQVPFQQSADTGAGRGRTRDSAKIEGALLSSGVPNLAQGESASVTRTAAAARNSPVRGPLNSTYAISGALTARVNMGIGDVVVPFAVTFSTLACVISPP